jgi:hypothetical protein
MNIHAWRLQNPHDIVESKFQISTAWNTWKHFVEGSVTVFMDEIVQNHRSKDVSLAAVERICICDVPS